MVDGAVCFGGAGRVRWRARAQRVPGHTVGEREATPRAQGARQSHEDALRQRVAFALASTTIRDLGEASGKVIRTATLCIVIFTVLVVGGSCNYLVARWDLGAESAWTGLGDEDGSRRREASGRPAEGSPGGVRAGEVHAGMIHEELMPEFRVETFEEGYAAAKAELGEATKQESTNYGKVKAAAKALGKVAAVTDAASVMSDIDARFLRPYLTINGSLPASGRASPERSRPPSRADGESRADDGEGGNESDGGFRTVPLDTVASEGNVAEEASPETPLGLPGSPAPPRPLGAPPSN